MSEQEDEVRSGQQLADPSTAKSPQDGSVTVKRPVKVDKKKKQYARPSPQDPSAKWLALMEEVSRESRESGEMSESEVLKKNTEDILALEQKYEELRSTVEALQSELRGRSNCVDQV
ncbi:hypothetical protein H9Q69_011116 [Fusarium xylarioides]|uniref:Uncharacterized protein n=1 Tax=Fusarium xylarioides TaxID=221167 RepID=A0A9P7I4I7_9HYPO|nr:hypothetical protein H9Q70_014283 [Fusarium xylarioides]KAG5767645.1 hypothetical protein H9Q73_014074 [Fusarium xylarioides]KAG5774495.1 hypothetical protein H9Q72_000182 [Fusarium xylarioides]KAG5789833.1 hypothetical protein H9Q69_011116 [Fusarium xylarioides]KAG5802498.1 hypothetical protein H9Q71_012920 [Fusarium xylarioides]